MPGPWPDYYTRLAPFRELFAGGRPILTYHKFGPRPSGVRLRGLYLGTRLFESQLRELTAAGYRPGGLGSEVRSGGMGEPTVTLTIDDGFRSVLTEALPVLVRHRWVATLYLVAERLGGWNDWEQAQGEAAAPLMSVGEVREWLAAGQRIGSHTLTHPWLTRLPREQAQREIGLARRKLEDEFQVPVTDFCYPYGDWNPGVRDAVEEAGYRTATTTDFGVNTGSTNRWELRRITARHASRGWRAVRLWWGRVRGRGGR